MSLFDQLLRLFNNRERWKLAGVSMMLFLSALLEVAGVGIILPFIKIVGNPNLLLRNTEIGPQLARLGIITPRQAIVAACLCLLVVSLAKGLYLTMSLRIAYHFIYNKVLSLQKDLLTAYL